MITLHVVDDIISRSGCWCKPLQIFISLVPIDSANPTTQIYNGEPNDGAASYRIEVPDSYKDLTQYIRLQKEQGMLILCEAQVFLKGNW